jgi:hypothetical protein
MTIASGKRFMWDAERFLQSLGKMVDQRRCRERAPKAN